MTEAGMYSILLKWGLETAAGILRDKDPKHLEIVLEAIKTRNAIVLKRFDHAWTAAQGVNDLLTDLEADLMKLIREVSAKTASDKRLRRFKARLRNEFHPVYYRRIRRMRISFEATNDLLSAYSIEFQAMLEYGNMNKLINRSPQTISDVARTYRHVWESFAAVLATLIRVTSSDLRFWLADVSYFRYAERQAALDRGIVEKHFLTNDRASWSMSIEDPVVANKFWQAVGEASELPMSLRR